MPSATTVGANLELGNGLVGIDNLHREPVLGSTFLVLKLKGAGEVAGGVLPGDVDNAGGDVGELGEGVLEEVKVAGGALGALVDNL